MGSVVKTPVDAQQCNSLAVSLRNRSLSDTDVQANVQHLASGTWTKILEVSDSKTMLFGHWPKLHS